MKISTNYLARSFSLAGPGRIRSGRSFSPAAGEKTGQTGSDQWKRAGQIKLSSLLNACARRNRCRMLLWDSGDTFTNVLADNFLLVMSAAGGVSSSIRFICAWQAFLSLFIAHLVSCSAANKSNHRASDGDSHLTMQRSIPVRFLQRATCWQYWHGPDCDVLVFGSARWKTTGVSSGCIFLAECSIVLPKLVRFLGTQSTLYYNSNSSLRFAVWAF